MISLDYAIRHIREHVAIMQPGDYRDEHKRLAGWLEELRTLREVLAAAKNALPHINDVTNAAYDSEQRLRRAIESAEKTNQPGS